MLAQMSGRMEDLEDLVNKGKEERGKGMQRERNQGRGIWTGKETVTQRY